MATRKPLVIVNGEVQQLQSGDALSGVELGQVSLTNSNAAAIPICAPVYADGAGTVDLAQADAMGTSEVVGLAVAEIAIAGDGLVQTDGYIEATTSEWDAVTGETGGLVADTVYWLDPDTAGLLTITAPTADADVVARVGKALSTTQLLINVQPPILL